MIWSNDMTLLWLPFLKNEIFTVIIQMYFKVALNEFENLEDMINVTVFLVKYQTGATADHCL